MSRADPLANLLAEYSDAKPIEAFASALRRFTKDWLAEWLDEHLRDRNFQDTNIYGEAVILAETPTMMVRVCNWFAHDHGEYEPIAHTHAFELLTFGLAGEGYTTDLYSCSPNELERAAGGDTVRLGRRRTLRLAEGTVFRHPPFTVAHVQHPPDEHSISLNLLRRVPNPKRYRQAFVDPATRVLLRRAPVRAGT